MVISIKNFWIRFVIPISTDSEWFNASETSRTQTFLIGICPQRIELSEKVAVLLYVTMVKNLKIPSGILRSRS